MVRWVKYQIDLLFLATAFLTRLPVPSVKEYSEQKLNQARRYFPVVGLWVGSICAAALYGFAQYLPIEIAVLLSMIISLFVTGVFHEDGLTDSADGLGGGWNAEQKLTIMKDSRIGTYGSAALWGALTLKFFLLTALANINLSLTALALISFHSLSRSLSSVLVSCMSYVRTSSTKPVVQLHQQRDTVISCVIALIAMAPFYQEAAFILPVLIIFLLLWRGFLIRQIGGYTGDTLGAAQQIAELLCYLILLAVWRGAIT